jgi:hypothetical protein
MTRTLGTALACLLLATAARGDEVLREISWSALKGDGLPSAGEVRAAGGDAAFEHLAVASAPGPRTIPLLALPRPGITRARYALVGQVRYEGVEGAGYLEMWSEIPGQGRFFTRTLGDAGPMARIEGSSAWREFALPFDATGAPAPSRLTVNLVLPGRGSVALGPLRLVQYGAADSAAGTGWWGPRAAGVAGAAVGTTLGAIGALVGVLASRGRGRGLILGLLNVEMALGAIALAAGVAAVAKSQPYEVYYPLLLCGALCFGLPFYVRPLIKRRFEDLELRKMTAQDLASPIR